jgi:hypothetical protein
LIIDSSSSDLTDIPSSDVLIVGSGPVGLILAVALERLGLSVLILEAGGYFVDASVQNDLRGQCIGAALPGLVAGRTRQVGGGLNLWGGQVALFEHDDFLRGEMNRLMNWPITYDDVYGSIDEVMKFFDSASIDLDATPKPIKHENNLAYQYGLQIFQTAWLKHPKLDGAFWKKLRRTKKISLFYNLPCIGVDYDADVERVRGVKAISRSGRRISLNADHIVLAAGSLENARLLLLPTANGGLAPWHERKWLGCGFNEHVDATTAEIEIVDRSRISEIFDLSIYRGFKYSPKITWSKRQRIGREVSACGILLWPGNIRNSVSELVSLGRALFVGGHVSEAFMLPRAIASSVRQVVPLAYRYAKQRRIGSFTDRNAYLRCSTEQPIRAESKIVLSLEERDRYGIPRMVVNWIRADAELHSLREFTAAVRRWLEEEKMAKVHMDPSLDRMEPAFFDKVDDGLHHAGTTRMGLSPDTSVVNSDLRVHGTNNLYVCGASVFPSSGCANPTLTAMALAVRLAKTIATRAYGR